MRRIMSYIMLILSVRYAINFSPDDIMFKLCQYKVIKVVIMQELIHKCTPLFSSVSLCLSPFLSS